MKIQAVVVSALAGVLLPFFGGGFVQADTRQYTLGDTDDFVYEGTGSVDDVYVNPDLVSYLSGAWSEPQHDFDVYQADHVVPFSFTFPLAAGEQVTAAWLTMGLRYVIGTIDSDKLWLYTMPDNQLWDYRYDDLGWLPIPSSPTVERTVDLANVLGDDHLDLLQDRMFDAFLQDDCAVDYAILTIEVIPGPASMALLGLGSLALLRRR